MNSYFMYFLSIQIQVFSDVWPPKINIFLFYGGLSVCLCKFLSRPLFICALKDFCETSHKCSLLPKGQGHILKVNVIKNVNLKIVSGV